VGFRGRKEDDKVVKWCLKEINWVERKRYQTKG
jgi:hypothetical protein